MAFLIYYYINNKFDWYEFYKSNTDSNNPNSSYIKQISILVFEEKMKFWKSLKSSSGSWTKGPANGTEDDNGGSRSTGNQIPSTNKHYEQRRNGSSSQLHSVRPQSFNFWAFLTKSIPTVIHLCKIWFFILTGGSHRRSYTSTFLASNRPMFLFNSHRYTKNENT